MKQFNLEKALDGEKVITRDGIKVKIVDYCEVPQYGLVGWVCSGKEWVLGSWTKDGKYNTNYDSIFDLFMAPTTKTVWYALAQDLITKHIFPSISTISEESLRDSLKSYKIILMNSIEIEL